MRSTTPTASYAGRLAPRASRDTSVVAREALARGESILLEGAQGALLDLDGGTYDYVTSSVPSSTSAGAAIGIGIGPADITKVVGVYKAYMTRVGNGPMPTELLDEDGQILRIQGPRPEIGTTTGRPRRTGWFDAVASRYSAQLNSVTVDRPHAPRRARPLPVDQGLHRLQDRRQDRRHAAGQPRRLQPRRSPQYEELPGWQADCTGARTLRRPAAERPALRQAPRRADRQAHRDRLGRSGARAGHHRRRSAIL